MNLLLYSQAQFDTQNVLSDLPTISLDHVEKFFHESDGDFRFFFVEDNSVIFGRDIFGRKSLCGRLGRLSNGAVSVEITAGFLNEKRLDCFEFPPGAIHRLEGISNVRSTNTSIFFDLDPDFLDNETLTVHTYYKLATDHPFYSLFKNIEILERDASDYLEPSTFFDVIPTSSEVDSMADALISRLSSALKSVFEPTLLVDDNLLNGNRGVPEQLSICFSGGVDSLMVTVIAALCLPDVKQFNLINTVFGECEKDFDSGTDRMKALECFDFLTKKLGSRFSMILVNAGREEVAQCRSQIESVMLPCHTILDESLASVVWFGSRAKGTQHFPPDHQGLKFKPSNCALVGSGADELLGGYARHRTTFEQGGWPKLYGELKMEIGRIGARNFGRDDRVALSNGVHLLAPFMSNDFVRWMNQVPIPYRVDFREPRGLGEKRLLRVALHRLGLPSHLTDTPKKAMQFGSGYAKLENRGRKGHEKVIPIC